MSFRVEWYDSHGKQCVRTGQTHDNVRELLDVIPNRGHTRIIEETSNLLIAPDLIGRAA